VDVVRQYNESVDFKRILVTRAGDRIPKRGDMVYKKRSSALQQVDREEPASTLDEGAAIIRHDEKVARERRSSADYASLIRPTP
jgi:hypothetical protein